MLSLSKHLYRAPQRKSLPLLLLVTICVAYGLTSCGRHMSDAAFEQALADGSLKSGHYRVTGKSFYSKGRVSRGKRTGLWKDYNSYGEPLRIREFTKDGPRVNAVYNPIHR